MMGLAFAAMAMLEQASAIVWKNDGSLEVSITFAADDPRNPFPQGTKLLTAKAAEACANKGAPVVVAEPVVTGIALAGGRPQISMSGTYACGKG